MLLLFMFLEPDERVLRNETGFLGNFVLFMLSDFLLGLEWVNRRSGDVWVTDKFQGPWLSSDTGRFSRLPALDFR